MSTNKKSLNEVLFNTCYWWACNEWRKPYLACSSANIDNPVAKSLSRKDSLTGIGMLVLNLSPSDCMTETTVEGLFFSGRFGGKKEEFTIPWSAMYYLYNPNAVEGDRAIILADVLSSGLAMVSPKKEEKPTRPILKLV